VSEVSKESKVACLLYCDITAPHHGNSTAVPVVALV